MNKALYCIIHKTNIFQIQQLNKANSRHLVLTPLKKNDLEEQLLWDLTLPLKKIEQEEMYIL